MTNKQQIPSEELKRINDESIEFSENEFDPGDYRDTAYISYKTGKENEYLRAHSSQPSGQLHWVKASEQMPAKKWRGLMKVLGTPEVDTVGSLCIDGKFWDDYHKNAYDPEEIMWLNQSTPTVEPGTAELIKMLKKREKSVSRVSEQFPYWEGSRDTFRWLIKHLQGEPNDNFPEDHIPDFDAVEPAVETEKKPNCGCTDGEQCDGACYPRFDSIDIERAYCVGYINGGAANGSAIAAMADGKLKEAYIRFVKSDLVPGIISRSLTPADLMTSSIQQEAIPEDFYHWVDNWIYSTIGSGKGKEFDEKKKLAEKIAVAAARYFLSPPSVKTSAIPDQPSNEVDHVHVALPSGAVANVSANASPELLDALNTMTELAIKAVDSQSPEQPQRELLEEIVGKLWEKDNNTHGGEGINPHAYRIGALAMYKATRNELDGARQTGRIECEYRDKIIADLQSQLYNLRQEKATLDQFLLAERAEKGEYRTVLERIASNWSEGPRHESQTILDKYPSSSTPIPVIPDPYHPLPAMVRINGKESWRLLVPIVGYTDAWNAIGAVAGECDEVRRENILYWANDQTHD